MTERRGRMQKQLLDVIKEKKTYYKLEVGALNRTPCRTYFGRDSGLSLDRLLRGSESVCEYEKFEMRSFCKYEFSCIKQGIRSLGKPRYRCDAKSNGLFS